MEHAIILARRTLALIGAWDIAYQVNNSMESWQLCRFTVNTVNLDDPNLETKLEQWQFHYNWHRPHGSLNGKASIEKCCELNSKTPFWDDVEAKYDDSKERFQEPNYWLDLELKKLKPCL